ncbi:unnamed protein product [Lupinus luteus]|uniref:Uncharacterized protein n=1 Tax=Lupinus luteus TaxID=3873 RepID=A0AAV1Y2J4_LUPLU
MDSVASLLVDDLMVLGKEAFETATSVAMKRRVASYKDIYKGVGVNSMFNHTDEDEEAEAIHECFGSDSESEDGQFIQTREKRSLSSLEKIYDSETAWKTSSAQIP